MRPAPDVLGEPIRFTLNWDRRYCLWVFNVGVACCAVEFVATSMGQHDFTRLGIMPFASRPDRADLLVVSGTVTDAMAPAIKRVYDQMPRPRYVVSFGACANCGGPYWDSYSVTKGIDQLIPVDVYVPGCPPRPEALLHGLLRLRDQIVSAGDSEGASQRSEERIERAAGQRGRVGDSEGASQRSEERIERAAGQRGAGPDPLVGSGAIGPEAASRTAEVAALTAPLVPAPPA